MGESSPLSVGFRGVAIASAGAERNSLAASEIAYLACYPLVPLSAALEGQRALLILDNCEHVIESAAKFADRVLGECRLLRILATSREPLGITGEALWLVEPLPLPTEASSGEIESSPAVRLLRDLGAYAGQGFSEGVLHMLAASRHAAYCLPVPGQMETSPDTRELSRLGSTACKALYVCNHCLEPFDHFKAI